MNGQNDANTAEAFALLDAIDTALYGRGTLLEPGFLDRVRACVIEHRREQGQKARTEAGSAACRP